MHALSDLSKGRHLIITDVLTGGSIHFYTRYSLRNCKSIYRLASFSSCIVFLN